MTFSFCPLIDIYENSDLLKPFSFIILMLEQIA